MMLSLDCSEIKYGKMDQVQVLLQYFLAEGPWARPLKVSKSHIPHLYKEDPSYRNVRTTDNQYPGLKIIDIFNLLYYSLSNKLSKVNHD